MMQDDEPVSSKTAIIALLVIMVALLTLAQCAIAREMCKFDKVTYYNFDAFPDDYRFTVEEMIYASNHDKGRFGIEGYPKFEGDNVIFINKDKRPVYELTLNKNLFDCEKK